MNLQGNLPGYALKLIKCIFYFVCYLMIILQLFFTLFSTLYYRFDIEQNICHAYHTNTGNRIIVFKGFIVINATSMVPHWK